MSAIAILASAVHRFAVVYHASDTMFLVGLGSVFAAALDPADARLSAVALSFLGIQVLLAYVMTGKAKVTAAAWRDGSHLVEILRDSAFRMEPCGRWLSRHPLGAALIARGTIGLELAFPLGLLLPFPLFITLLAVGLIFHAAVAFIMGLPGFFWSFVAAYPGIYFIHQSIAASF
jgi:hypothetical protein